MTDDGVAVLRAAKERISDPERWTQGAMARSAKGRWVLLRSPRAVQWCAVGAVLAERGRHSECSVASACRFLGNVALETGQGVGGLNDATDHATVMDLFDRAIALAEETKG